jgi:hypothetical protein
MDTPRPTLLPVSDGSIHLYATGNSNGTQATASAQLQDVLTFSASGASLANPIDIGVSLRISGSLTGGPSSSAEIDLADFEFDGSTDGVAKFVGDLIDNVSTISLETSSGWVSANFAGTTAQGLVFDGIYALTDPSEVVNLVWNTQASVSSEDSATANYADTGQISLNLPTGVTFRSGSGVFLTASTALPEPSTLALFGAGLFALGVLRQRRRKA